MCCGSIKLKSVSVARTVHSIPSLIVSNHPPASLFLIATKYDVLNMIIYSTFYSLRAFKNIKIFASGDMY
jgi:hypothetical protein